MDFTMYEEDEILKLTFHQNNEKEIKFSLGELFVDLMNYDFNKFINEFEIEEQRWKEKYKNSKNHIDNYKEFYKTFKELCKNFIPYPISIFFYLSVPQIVDDYFKHVKFEVKMYIELIEFRKSIFESIIARKNENFQTSEWTTRVEYFNSKFTEILEFPTIDHLTGFLLFQVLKNNIKINKCQNKECNKYFIPSSRSDEMYCNNVFRGNRTCKQIGYDNKVNSDEILKEYRKAYKTKNAFKNRNKVNNLGADAEFKKWVYKAKEKLEQCKTNEITLDEFRKWLNK